MSIDNEPSANNQTRNIRSEGPEATTDGQSTCCIEEVSRVPSKTERIAKDTGCCLYSAISVLVTMLAVLGIVLIVTGFGSGLSLIPPLNGIPSAAYNNENSAANDSAANETQKYGDSEYINEGIDATDHEWVDINATRSHDPSKNESSENLSDLQPEALRGYLYIPVPFDDGEDDEDGDVGITRVGRPEYSERFLGKLEPPPVFVPSPASWNHRIRNGDRPHNTDVLPRRFDESTYRDSSEAPRNVRPKPLRPTLNRPPSLNYENRPSPEIDYRMFGSLAPPSALRKGGDQGDSRPEPSIDRPRLLPRPNRYPRPLVPSRDERDHSTQKHLSGHRQGSQPLQRRVPPFNPHPKSPNAVYRKVKPEPYDYPRDAMNIQDIIGYMTSLGHSNERDNSASTLYRTKANRPRRPPVQSPVSGRDLGDEPAQPAVRGKSPFSFMLDVYPLKDSVGRAPTKAQAPPEFRYVNADSERYRGPVNIRAESTLLEAADEILEDDDEDEGPPLVRSKGIIASSPYGDVPPPQVKDPNRPKEVVVHLNVYRKSGDHRSRVDGESEAHHDTDDFYSPSDVYRAVLRNNAWKRDRYSSEFARTGIEDDSLSGGESQVFVTHKVSNEEDSSSGGSYKNHRMSVEDARYRPAPPSTRFRPQSSPSEKESRFHSDEDDRDYEPLPRPMARQSPEDVTSKPGRISLIRRVLG